MFLPLVLSTILSPTPRSPFIPPRPFNRPHDFFALSLFYIVHPPPLSPHTRLDFDAHKINYYHLLLAYVHLAKLDGCCSYYPHPLSVY